MTFSERMKSTRDAQAGFTMIEVVLTLSILTMVLLLTLFMFQSTITTQGSVQGAATTTSESQIAVRKFDKDVRDAMAVKVLSVQSFDLQTSSNTCKRYEVRTIGARTYLLSRESTGPAAQPGLSSPSKTLLTDISRSGSTPYFVARGSGVQYSFNRGIKVGKITLSGVAIPRVAPGTTSPCWS